MKKIITLLHILAVTGIVAQVGINTQNPQQEVHLAGSTENVRVEGLNAANNVNNLGNGSTTRVLVDEDGDLILGTADE